MNFKLQMCFILHNLNAIAYMYICNQCFECKLCSCIRQGTCIYECIHTSFLTAPLKTKKINDRKRKAVSGQETDKRRRIKQEPPEGDLSEQDRENIERWKHMQQSTKPFTHPIRKLKTSESGVDTETLIREQAKEVEQLKAQLDNQSKIISEQREQIKLLQEHRVALMQECQKSGTKIPPSVLSDISKRASVQTPPPSLHSSSQPLRPPQPSVSPALPRHPQMMPQHPLPPSVMSNSQPPPLIQPQQIHYLQPSMSTGNTPQNISLSTVSAYPLPPQHFMPPRAMRVSSILMDQHHGQLMPPMPVGMRTSSDPLPDISFSPLNSSDFKKLERENVTSDYDPFPEDFENILDIAGLPTGSGAGYGVGVSDEDEFNRSPVPLSINIGYVSVIDIWYVSVIDIGYVSVSRYCS